jgi:hypothetical protein
MLSTKMLILSGKLAANSPAAKTSESPVMKGIKAPISNPVPAKTSAQTAITKTIGPIWSYQSAICSEMGTY